LLYSGAAFGDESCLAADDTYSFILIGIGWISKWGLVGVACLILRFPGSSAVNGLPNLHLHKIF
jgi:hypothetical protein